MKWAMMGSKFGRCDDCRTDDVPVWGPFKRMYYCASCCRKRGLGDS